MKISNLAISVLAITLGMSSVANARNNAVYNPPERINCGLSAASQLSCGDFNHNYLGEGLYTAEFNPGQEQAFYFASAAAYFTTNHQEARVFFTYRNAKGKMVRLETFNTSIQPDLASGSWKAVGTGNDIFTCNEGYMNCGITNLPQ